MTPYIHIWHFIVIAMAGWLNRHQQAVVEYLQEENRLLKEKLGRRRIVLNNDERRRLAVKGKALGRKILREVATIVSPDTILAWHRKLIAKKWDDSCKRGPGRPRVQADIAELVVRMATENPSWGYTRIVGALSNLGHKVSRTAVASILRENGLEPAPKRGKKTTWHTFLKSHWGMMAATDFFTVEVWMPWGLVTYYILFVLDIATLRVEIAGITPNPNEAWMMQIGRNLTDPVDGFLSGKRYIIMDRDAKYTDAFRNLLEEAGTRPVRLPARSPDLNPHAERFVLSAKSECLDRMIFFGETSLRKALKDFVVHYHIGRNHQGLDNLLIQPGGEVGKGTGAIQRKERLGGLLNYYYRQAA